MYKSFAVLSFAAPKWSRALQPPPRAILSPAPFYFFDQSSFLPPPSLLLLEESTWKTFSSSSSSSSSSSLPLESRDLLHRAYALKRIRRSACHVRLVNPGFLRLHRDCTFVETLILRLHTALYYSLLCYFARGSILYFISRVLYIFY